MCVTLTEKLPLADLGVDKFWSQNRGQQAKPPLACCVLSFSNAGPERIDLMLKKFKQRLYPIGTMIWHEEKSAY